MNLTTFLIVLIALIIYGIWYVLHQLIFSRVFCRKPDRIIETFYLRISGFFILGIGTFLLASKFYGLGLTEMGIQFKLSPGDVKYMVTAVLIFPVLMIYYGSKKENLWQYPRIRANIWTGALIILSALSWIPFLLAYEFFFRGFLLFPAISRVGIFWAILINAAMYTLFHVGQGYYRVVGAFLFSIVLCLIAHSTGSFIVPFVIQVIYALSSEWFSLYYHPDMKVKGLI